MSIPGSQPEGQDQTSTPSYYGAQPPTQQPQNPWPQQQPPPTQYGQPGPSWPPPPGQADGAAWPPPAYGMPVQQAQPFSMWFENLTGRKLEGNVTDFRVGNMWFTDEGLVIDGQAVMPMEQRTPVTLCFLLFGIGVVIAALILEAGFRKQKQLIIPWASVRQIAYTPKRDIACVSFDAPSFYGKKPVKTFSLAFKLRPMYVEQFIDVAQYYASGKVEQKKVGSATSPVLWGVLIVMLLAIFGLAIWAGVSGGK